MEIMITFLSSLNVCPKIFNQSYRGRRVWLEKDQSFVGRKRSTTTKRFSLKFKTHTDCVISLSFLLLSRPNIFFRVLRNLAKKLETYPNKVWDIFALTSAKKGTCWLSPKKNLNKEGKKLSLEFEKRKMNGEKKTIFISLPDKDSV